MSLRIVKGNLVGPSKNPIRQGQLVWRRGELITNPKPSFVSGWSTKVEFPSGKVSQTVYLANNSKDARAEKCDSMAFLELEEIFESREDAITPIEISNGAEVRPGDTVWIYVPSYKGAVQKVVVAYTHDKVVLAYPDVYANRESVKGGKTRWEDPKNVFASKEELLRKYKMKELTAAPLRAVHKVVKSA